MVQHKDNEISIFIAKKPHGFVGNYISHKDLHPAEVVLNYITTHTHCALFSEQTVHSLTFITDHTEKHAYEKIGRLFLNSFDQ